MYNYLLPHALSEVPVRLNVADTHNSPAPTEEKILCVNRATWYVIYLRGLSRAGVQLVIEHFIEMIEDFENLRRRERFMKRNDKPKFWFFRLV